MLEETTIFAGTSIILRYLFGSIMLNLSTSPEFSQPCHSPLLVYYSSVSLCLFASFSPLQSALVRGFCILLSVTPLLRDIDESSENGMHEQEIKSIKTLLRVDPKCAPLYSSLGSAYFELGLLDEAEQSVRTAIQIRPRASYFCLLGCILDDKGLTYDAVDSYQESIRLDPDFEESYFNLANVMSRLGDLERAEDLLQNAIKLDADYGIAYRELGWVRWQQGNSLEAEKLIRKSLEIEKRATSRGWAFLYLGDILSESGRYAQAEAEYLAALEHLPSGYSPVHALALFYEQQHRFSEAERFHRKARELAPKKEDLDTERNFDTR